MFRIGILGVSSMKYHSGHQSGLSIVCIYVLECIPIDLWQNINVIWSFWRCWPADVSHPTMCTPELSECWISEVSSNNIVSSSVYCLQSIIRLAYDVPLVSGAPQVHYSLHTYHPGPFSSTISVYMCSPELLQCTVLNFERFDAGNVEKPIKRHTLTPAHRTTHSSPVHR